ncbi:MAG: 2Fe-2S iron-sulfur cluster binding domain-containing protein [Burkholderiaceae bacterium]|nr:2Fe-2S iron-sulfur cluster binding domain-containing protein [Burkholderiaceae bacterium]
MTAETLIDLHCRVNGQPVALRCPPTRRLLALLREDLGLAGAKPGCGVGRCGACLVWLDGEPANACLVMAYQLQGREVTSIEAVGASEASAPVREALARCGGVQCGYCSPGLVMMLTHLHQQQPRPDAQQAAGQLNGQLCRCTGYGGLQRTLAVLF